MHVIIIKWWIIELFKTILSVSDGWKSIIEPEIYMGCLNHVMILRNHILQEIYQWNQCRSALSKSDRSGDEMKHNCNWFRDPNWTYIMRIHLHLEGLLRPYNTTFIHVFVKQIFFTILI